MTTAASTHHTPGTDPAGTGRTTVVALARHAVSNHLRITEAQVDRAMARSAWSDIAEMLDREFAGTYRGYFPKCDTAILDEAVIAATFDALAILLDDARRAMRCGAWSPPAAPVGGRSDG